MLAKNSGHCNELSNSKATLSVHSYFLTYWECLFDPGTWYTSDELIVTDIMRVTNTITLIERQYVFKLKTLK